MLRVLVFALAFVAACSAQASTASGDFEFKCETTCQLVQKNAPPPTNTAGDWIYCDLSLAHADEVERKISKSHQAQSKSDCLILFVIVFKVAQKKTKQTNKKKHRFLDICVVTSCIGVCFSID
jgi:hypothetical protein